MAQYGNVGDAFLAGFQGVRAMQQQRFDNELNTRKLDQVDTQLGIEDRRIQVLEGDLQLKKDAAASQEVIAGNDQWIDTANAAGLLSKDRLSLNGEAMRAGIEKGDMTVTGVALDLVNSSGQLPEGSVAESIQPLPNGGYAITVRNPDGSMGAVTEDGTSNPDSKVVNFDVGKLVNIGNLHYQKNVVSNSSIFDPSQMRAQLDRIDSDSERNELLKKYEGIVQTGQVLDKVNQSGDVGAVRGITDVLASGDGQEASDQILSEVSNDLGIEDKVGVAQAEQPNPDKPKKVGRMAKSEELSKPTVKKVQKEIDQLSSRAKNARSQTARKAAATKLEAKQKELAELQKAEQPESVFSESPTATAIADKTNEQVDAAIASGEIKVTPEESRDVAQKMKDEGIEDIAGLLRLNDKDRAIARAVILSSTTDEVTRRALSDEINNIFETDAGQASYTVAEQEDDKNARATATNNRLKITNSHREWAAGEYDTAVDEATAWTDSVNKVWFGENGDESNLDKDTAKMIYRKFIPEMLFKAQRSKNPQEAKVRFDALSGAISTSVAAMAAEEEGGFKETIISFFRPDAEDNVEATDFDLSRVLPEYDASGKVIAYTYRDPDGNVNDERIMAGDLAKLDSNVEKIVREAAVYNSKKSG